jgi:hypothetical protein
MQAAVPSAAYDESEQVREAEPYTHDVPLPGLPPIPFITQTVPVEMWDKETPDDDPDPATRALAYRGRFKDIGESANLISFFLPKDYATLLPWEVNNDLMKPSSEIPTVKYEYKRYTISGMKLYRWKPGIGEGDPPPVVRVADYYLTPSLNYEALAHACSSWSKAQGAQDVALGAISTNVALNSTRFQLPDQPAFQGFFDQHSGQFTARIQNLKAFYNELLDQFGLDSLP